MPEKAKLKHGWVRSSERLPVVPGEDFWKDHGQVEVPTDVRFTHEAPSGKGRTYVSHRDVCKRPLAYPFWRKPLRISDYPDKRDLQAGNSRKAFMVRMSTAYDNMGQATGYYSLDIFRVPLHEYADVSEIPKEYVVMSQHGYRFGPEHAERLAEGIAWMQTFCDKMNEYPRLHTPEHLLRRFYPEEFGVVPLKAAMKGALKR